MGQEIGFLSIVVIGRRDNVLSSWCSCRVHFTVDKASRMSNIRTEPSPEVEAMKSLLPAKHTFADKRQMSEKQFQLLTRQSVPKSHGSVGRSRHENW
eukprot:FN603929.1.p1 GENE.FN603929.1~~FN603929.1.p1  ORF type:complete len:97 (-),score=10.20 FN603929.1:10-300(-)